MEPVFRQLLVLMVVVWITAVALRRLGLPTVMGELLMGILVGPAVLGLVEPTETIEALAELGIFFLMLHTGVKTNPKEFFSAVRVFFGVAVVGALVPFVVTFLTVRAFGYASTAAVFCGLTMTATAVVVTLKILNDLGLDGSRAAHIIVAACIFDDLIALIGFSVVLNIVTHDGADPISILRTGLSATLFFVVAIVIGQYAFRWFRHPFRHPQGQGFAFVLVLGLGFGLFAELIGLHIIIGAYLAGLFFREEVASPEVIRRVTDRLDGIAYTLLGPIFFISLGFHINFEGMAASSLVFLAAVTAAVAVGQILSAGLMARRIPLSWKESWTVGIGMCGRAEMAFVLSAIGLEIGAIDDQVFSVMIDEHLCTQCTHLLWPLVGGTTTAGRNALAGASLSRASQGIAPRRNGSASMREPL